MTGDTRSDRHRRAEARGYADKARLRGLIQATEVAFVPVACPFMGQAGSDRVTPSS